MAKIASFWVQKIAWFWLPLHLKLAKDYNIYFSLKCIIAINVNTNINNVFLVLTYMKHTSNVLGFRLKIIGFLLNVKML